MDPWGPKTYGSDSESATLIKRQPEIMSKTPLAQLQKVLIWISFLKNGNKEGTKKGRKSCIRIQLGWVNQSHIPPFDPSLTGFKLALTPVRDLWIRPLERRKTGRMTWRRAWRTRRRAQRRAGRMTWRRIWRETMDKGLEKWHRKGNAGWHWGRLERWYKPYRSHFFIGGYVTAFFE